MATQGPDFRLEDFLADLSHVVRPATARPLVVHDDELVTLPQGSVPNPTTLRIAGTLPTKAFELFRQVIPPGESSDMQRHYHETVHFVLAGEGRSEIEVPEDGPAAPAQVVTWTTGSFVYTPPWAWHRHFNSSAEHPVEFLTIESSRLLGLFGLVRRESAGLVSLDEARTRTHPPDPQEDA